MDLNKWIISKYDQICIVHDKSTEWKPWIHWSNGFFLLIQRISTRKPRAATPNTNPAASNVAGWEIPELEDFDGKIILKSEISMPPLIPGRFHESHLTLYHIILAIHCTYVYICIYIYMHHITSPIRYLIICLLRLQAKHLHQSFQGRFSRKELRQFEAVGATALSHPVVGLDDRLGTRRVRRIDRAYLYIYTDIDIDIDI